MTIQRTDDREICYMDADSVQFFAMIIKEWRINTSNRKFLMTPIMHDKTEAPIIDATEMYVRFLREKREEH